MDDYLLKTLDEMEKRTDKLRETVREAESERLYLLQSLNTMSQSQALVSSAQEERDELELFIDRLTNRLLTIDISVHIARSTPQEESLRLVRQFLKKLMRDDDAPGEGADGAVFEDALRRYRNSCLADEANGPVDCRFQAALLGCAGEDQKDIKKKLVALWDARKDADAQRRILASMDLT